MASSEASIALSNRSLRTIRTELEFLTDTGVISSEQLSSILAQLPAQTPLRAPLHAPVNLSPAISTPVEQLSDLSLKNSYPQTHSPAPLPPPAYATVPPVLSVASALYAYQPTDTGDLALQPNDRVQVIEHMNNDWWRGRNERTGLEGIFPRSYVNIIEEKGRPPLPHQPSSSGYGNMPLDIASSSSQPGRQTSKLEEHGKKFGKKMGNAAIFGAGATIGSNIVNGIF
ncbi:[PSI+] inducibility protein 3 [Cyphellophora attinorum]|uniref:[PSI+] inducibility protein 3 n=1 Tax=Cyphellophora attinorum TaxID=1664694 RepID=A0A0N1P0N3_9EURO|nr:[PSI+] inducibility protein 3 [Phialophora attinorum]KPI40302.1 [PSI+] inducibility protein 3 [Phialophora attinorum]